MNLINSKHIQESIEALHPLANGPEWWPLRGDKAIAARDECEELTEEAVCRAGYSCGCSELGIMLESASEWQWTGAQRGVHFRHSGDQTSEARKCQKKI